MKVLPREVPSLYGSFPVELHPELEGFVPSADLDKARNRACPGAGCCAAQQQRFQPGAVEMGPLGKQAISLSEMLSSFWHHLEACF